MEFLLLLPKPFICNWHQRYHYYRSILYHWNRTNTSVCRSGLLVQCVFELRMPQTALSSICSTGSAAQQNYMAQFCSNPPPPHPPLKFGNSHFEPGTPLTLKAGKEKKTTGKKRQVERLRVLFSDWNVLRYTAGGKNQRKSCCFFLPTATDLQFNSSSISSAFGITLSIGIMTKSMHSEG